MLKIHLKYTSENARRMKDIAVAAEVEQAFGKAVAARKTVRRTKKNDEDANEQSV
jgi:hypothetical protein